MNDDYRQLIDELHSRQVETYFQGPDQLVISRQLGLVMPSCGNSFSVSFRKGAWYLSTWAPTSYRVPDEERLVAVCVEFVDWSREAQSYVPTTLVERYGLTELSEDEAAFIFCE